MTEIAIENVSVNFGPRGSRQSVFALRDMNLSIARGETLCLIGPSGCGKTTSLRLINRMIEPSSGRVLVRGEDVANLNPVQLRRGIGYVIQSAGLFPHLSVRENVGLLPKLEGWPVAKVRARVDELLELVHLAPKQFGERYPAELSGGQAQRVGVARALALEPGILLMDEPFGALDPITRRELQEEFLELNVRIGKTVILVTHDLDEAARLANRVGILSAGELLQVGRIEELCNHPSSPYVARFMEQHAHVG